MATLEEVRAQASAALAAGNYARALDLALLAQRHFPFDIQTTRMLGKIQLETHRLDEAAVSFQTAVDVDPEDVVAWSALAIVAEEEGDLERALDHFERALDIDPANAEVAAEVTRLRSEVGQNRRPRPESSMHSMARRFLAEGKFESAVPWLQEALRLTPESSEVALALARALWQAWRPREAREVALEVLAKHPNCLKALTIAAAATYSSGGSDGRTFLERTGRLNPGNDVARACFETAGIAFPEEPGVPEIPDSEVQEPPAGHIAETGGEPATPRGESGLQAEAGETSEQVPARGLSEDGSEDVPAETNPLLRRLSALRDVRTEGGEGETGAPSSLADVEVAPVALDATEAGGIDPAGDPTRYSSPAQEDEGHGSPPAEERTAQEHINAGASYADQGLLDEALAEYKMALKKDPMVALDVSEALLALAETRPDSGRVRWLAGDALVTDGKFRRAVEQYLLVLRSATNEAASNQAQGPAQTG